MAAGECQTVLKGWLPGRFKLTRSQLLLTDAMHPYDGRQITLHMLQAPLRTASGNQHEGSTRSKESVPRKKRNVAFRAQG